MLKYHQKYNIIDYVATGKLNTNGQGDTLIPNSNAFHEGYYRYAIRSYSRNNRLEGKKSQINLNTGIKFFVGISPSIQGINLILFSSN